MINQESCYSRLITLNFKVHEGAYIRITFYFKKQNSNQNVKVGKMVVLVKAFDHCQQKFYLFQMSCKHVKEFEIEI